MLDILFEPYNSENKANSGKARKWEDFAKEKTPALRDDGYHDGDGYLPHVPVEPFDAVREAER